MQLAFLWHEKIELYGSRLFLQHRSPNLPLALFMQKTTVASSNPYLEIDNQGKIVRFDLTRDRHILGRDRTEGADLIVPPDWNVISRCHAVLCRDGEDYIIYDGDGKQKPSANGLFVNHTRITPSAGYRLRDNTELEIGQHPKNKIRLKYGNPNHPLSLPPSPGVRSISLRHKSVLIGRDPNANLQLDAPTVSRRHATIDTDKNDNYILHDGSTNGVFVDGQKVSGSTILKDGVIVRIGPYTLQLQGDTLSIVDCGEQIRLDAVGITRIVNSKEGSKTLLNNITIPIEPGQFVALVGGSGAGKSTLMRTLLGIDPTTQGTVYLNGDELRKNFNLYRTQIGYVPQDDIIHGNLTVEEALTYAAQLRLPPENVKAVVEKTLTQIKLSDRRNLFVHQLSGGQRKRVSIGVELLADPKLFFLDEPTSGLDPGLDKKMMQLLHDLAKEGRTVILVTHATANIKLCDRVAFLGLGGNLCYFGSPENAPRFFKINTGEFADDFSEIYTELEQEDELQTLKKVQEWEKRFRQSSDYQRYIANHLSAINGNSEIKKSPKNAKRSPLQQLTLLTQRYLQLIWRDRISLSLSLLTAPIGISLITLALRDKDPLILGSEPDPTLAPLALRVLFVFTCAAIWVGLSTSLQEIIKESQIYLRERLVNLRIFAYLGSKVVVLGGLAILQTFLITLVITWGFATPAPDIISWEVGASVTTFLTLLTSLSLGLFVSALVKNSSQANSTLPLLLLPQVIFSGVLFNMEGIASKLSWLMLSRWSVGAYGSLVNVNAMVPEPTKLLDGSTLPQPFEPTTVYDPTWENLGLNWGILCLHTLVYLGLTLWVQKRKDIL